MKLLWISSLLLGQKHVSEEMDPAVQLLPAHDEHTIFKLNHARETLALACVIILCARQLYPSLS